jgi:hypothetical protein
MGNKQLKDINLEQGAVKFASKMRQKDIKNKNKLQNIPDFSSTSQNENYKKFINNLHTYLMLIKVKLNSFRIKKDQELKNKKTEILEDLNGRSYDSARIKFEIYLRFINFASAFGILAEYCEKFFSRVAFLALCQDNLPPNDEIRADLDTLLFASSRINIDEFISLRELIKLKFGGKYLERASDNLDNYANTEIVNKMSLMPFDPIDVINKLIQFANDEKIQFEPPEHWFSLPFSHCEEKNVNNVGFMLHDNTNNFTINDN